MTIKEAIMLLNPKTTASALAEIEYYNGFSGKEACIEAIEDACRLATEALEKQVPKKPIKYDIDYSGNPLFRCPVCGDSWNSNEFGDGMEHCWTCGQAILWEDCD